MMVKRGTGGRPSPGGCTRASPPGRGTCLYLRDAGRPGRGDGEAEVSGAQVREVVTGLVQAGPWHQGDPDILVVFDAGYDVTRLAYLLAGLPVELLGRLRSDRVLYFPAPPRRGGRGRPSPHGTELKLADESSRLDPPATPTTQTTPHRTALARAWD